MMRLEDRPQKTRCASYISCEITHPATHGHTYTRTNALTGSQCFEEGKRRGEKGIQHLRQPLSIKRPENESLMGGQVRDIRGTTQIHWQSCNPNMKDTCAFICIWLYFRPSYCIQLFKVRIEQAAAQDQKNVISCWACMETNVMQNEIIKHLNTLDLVNVASKKLKLQPFCLLKASTQFTVLIWWLSYLSSLLAVGNLLMK